MSKQPLKAITLHRPWGHAIAHLGKDIENRTWKCPLPIGTYIAIHNGKKWDDSAVEFIRDVTDIFDATMNPVEDPSGAIIAIARFDGNTEDAPISDWFMGPIGWKLSDVAPISPIYCRGQQGLWNVEGEALEQCRAAYKAAKSLELLGINAIHRIAFIPLPERV